MNEWMKGKGGKGKEIKLESRKGNRVEGVDK